jgi:hypothetical protein
MDKACVPNAETEIANLRILNLLVKSHACRGLTFSEVGLNPSAFVLGLLIERLRKATLEGQLLKGTLSKSLLGMFSGRKREPSVRVHGK